VRTTEGGFNFVWMSYMDGPKVNWNEASALKNDLYGLILKSKKRPFWTAWRWKLKFIMHWNYRKIFCETIRKNLRLSSRRNIMLTRNLKHSYFAYGNLSSNLEAIAINFATKLGPLSRAIPFHWHQWRSKWGACATRFLQSCKNAF